MPPRRITGVISARKASAKLLPSASHENAVSAVVSPVRVPGHGGHHEKAHDDPRDHAGEKKLTYGDAGHHSIDDERQRRRNDGAERRRGGGHADGKIDRIAVVLHRLDLDRAQPGCVGDRRSRHAGEDHRADDVHVPEPALQPAHQRQREVVDAVGNSRGIHQIAREDKERHREQRERVYAAVHAVDDDEIRNGA
jgi:hypothetical protein